MRDPTQQEIDDYCNSMMEKIKQDSQWELQMEFGRLLMRHIDSFTPEERKRYDELKAILHNPKQEEK